MISLNQLAKRLGMAKSTVSRVLNDHPHVSEKTRQRVLQAAEDMGYQRSGKMSEAMRAARTGKPGTYRETVACVSFVRSLAPLSKTNADDSDTDIPRRRLYRLGIEQRCAELGCAVDFFHLEEVGLERLMHILETRGIRRVIVFAPINIAGLLRLREMTQLRDRFSAVFIGTPNMYPNLATMIQPDLFAAGFQALVQAWLAGYHRVVILEQIRSINFDGRFMSGVAYARESFQGEVDVSEVPHTRTTSDLSGLVRSLPRRSCVIGGILPSQTSWIRENYPSQGLPGWMDWHANLHQHTARATGIDQRDLDQARRAVDIVLAAPHSDHASANYHPSDKLLLDPGWVQGETLTRLPQPHDGLGRCLAFPPDPRNLRFHPVSLPSRLLIPSSALGRLLKHFSFPFPKAGRSRFHSIPFKIPESRAIVVCASSDQPGIRASVSVPCARRASEIYFLHAACHARDNGRLGAYKIRYADGSYLEIPVITSLPGPRTTADERRSSNVRDWWYEIPPLENEQTLPVRSLHSTVAYQFFGFHYLFRWMNPCPGKLIEHISLNADCGKETALILFGITCAEDVFERA